jgi:hypothetical protein
LKIHAFRSNLNSKFAVKKAPLRFMNIHLPPKDEHQISFCLSESNPLAATIFIQFKPKKLIMKKSNNA